MQSVSPESCSDDIAYYRLNLDPFITSFEELYQPFFNHLTLSMHDAIGLSHVGFQGFGYSSKSASAFLGNIS